MRYKILLVLSILILFTSFYGMAFSFFSSDAGLDSGDINVAKFIFNAESLDEFQLSLVDLYPGESKEYPFSVSNSNESNISDVTLEYQLTFKTYHFVPLAISLYKMNELEEEELILTCDETYTRNDQNELVCDTPIQEIGHTADALDNYKIKVDFPSEYNDAAYADLVDYINVEIKSWQKLGD